MKYQIKYIAYELKKKKTRAENKYLSSQSEKGFLETNIKGIKSLSNIGVYRRCVDSRQILNISFRWLGYTQTNSEQISDFTIAKHWQQISNREVEAHRFSETSTINGLKDYDYQVNKVFDRR